MSFSTLRNIQGLHAPLKLQMEYRAARQVTGRVSLTHIYSPLRPFYLFADVSFILDVAAPSDPAAAIFTQFKPGCGYSAGQWRVHRLWRHPKWSESDPHGYSHPDTCLNIDPDICFVLSPCRSSSEWNDGWSTPDGGVQTGTVVKERRICKDTLMQDWCCCSQKGGGCSDYSSKI